MSSLRLCTHAVVSERFHNSENDNDTNYKSPHCMKFSVFIQRRGLCWFSLKHARKLKDFWKYFKMKTLGNDTVCI